MKYASIKYYRQGYDGLGGHISGGGSEMEGRKKITSVMGFACIIDRISLCRH